MKTLLALALAALPAIAAAHPEAGADPEIQRLRREIAAAKLDRLLDLSRDQAQKLLPILKESQGLVAQQRAEQQKRKAQLVAALTQVRDDIRAKGVASESSIAALKQARGDAEMKQTFEAMRSLREKARAIATEEQVARLFSFDPNPAGGPDADEGGMGPGSDGGPGAGGPGKHRGHGGPHGRNRAAMMTVLSPEFVSLVEARAK
jgi:hypothetical protein